jgi:hypothetical protein
MLIVPIVAFSASAQTVCFGANCEIGSPGYSDPGAPGGDSLRLDRDAWSPGIDFGRWYDDEERQECFIVCNVEYEERTFDCVAIYESSLSPFSESHFYACLAYANERRAECYSPGSLLQCEEEE